MLRFHTRLFPWGKAASQRWAPGSPIEQSMVQVFTEPLQDLVMVSDCWCLIFTGSKVALQLQKKKKKRNGMAGMPFSSPRGAGGGAKTLISSIKQFFVISQLAKPCCRFYLWGVANGFERTLKAVTTGRTLPSVPTSHSPAVPWWLHNQVPQW